MSIGVINQWTISDTGGYGPVQTPVAFNGGNALVAFVAAGGDYSNSGSGGYVPRLTLSDDAHNLWQFAGGSFLEFAGGSRRVDVWICPNAKAASVVNVASNIMYAGIIGAVCEVTGFPQWATVDITMPTTGNGTSWSPSGTLTTADFIMGANFFFGVSPGTITWPTGATVGTTQTSSEFLGDMGQITGAPFWFPNSVAAGAQSYPMSWTTSCRFSGVIVAFKSNPPAPVTGTNPNAPAVKVEAAFGWQPGSVSGAMPTWTDITSRAIGDDGTTVMSLSRGRDYELNQPEAGSLTLSLNNEDGAFSPESTSSPWFGQVLPEVPVRVSAVWQGQLYGLGYYYANKWTQDFPTAQWGFIDLEASDAIGMASQGAMPSAYAGQVLCDFPQSYWPLGEYYQGAHGALFSNLSRGGSQKPMVGYSPNGFSNGGVLSTGMSIGQGLAGDPSTGIGLTGFSATNFTALEGGAGALIRDNAFPSLSAGITFEFWVNAPNAGGNASTAQIFNVLGVPSNYLPSTAMTNGQRLAVSYYGGIANNIQWTTELISPAGASIAFGQTNTPTKQQNHVVVAISTSGSSWNVFVYVNGTQIGGTLNGVYAGAMDWSVLAAGPVIPTGGTALVNNYAMGQVAVYPWVLPLQRIKAHYSTGSTADSGDTVAARIGKLFQWASFSSLPVGVSLSPQNPLLGNADQIQNSALADALYAISLDEGGMFYAPSSLNGEIWYATRTSLYNKLSKYTFGDNGTSEIPYDSGLGFDFSDQFLFNIVSSQRTINSGNQLVGATNNGVPTGPQTAQKFNNTGIDAVAADQTSQTEYFSRALQQDIETTSDQDALDRANWGLAKYKQPQLRANQIVVHCSATPSAFATMLSVEQGDVVTVNRRPIGYTQPVSLQCIVQKVEHAVGPNMWDVTLTLAPYFPESNVLQLDVSGFNVLGNNALAW